MRQFTFSVFLQSFLANKYIEDYEVLRVTERRLMCPFRAPEAEISWDIKCSAYGNIFVLLCSSWLFAFLSLVTWEVTILLFTSQQLFQKYQGHQHLVFGVLKIRKHVGARMLSLCLQGIAQQSHDFIWGLSACPDTQNNSPRFCSQTSPCKVCLKEWLHCCILLRSSWQYSHAFLSDSVPYFMVEEMLNDSCPLCHLAEPGLVAQGRLWLSQHLLQEHPAGHLWPAVAVPDKSYQRSPADVLLSLFSLFLLISANNLKCFFSNK